jgi:hypothetical protein
MSLEKRLIEMCKNDDFDLAEAALIASGVRNDDE